MDNVTVEYAGPASRQVGSLPMHDVRAWWTVGRVGVNGLVKLAAGRAVKRHVPGVRVEFVSWDVDTYKSPHLNAMITFRVLTPEQFAAREELRARRYGQCDAIRCGDDAGQLVRLADGTERALCCYCWQSVKDTAKLLHWIGRGGKLLHV